MKSRLKRLVKWLCWAFGICILSLAIASCSADRQICLPGLLNSRYSDEQPALSGDGRWLAYVSDRDGKHRLLLYDLQDRCLVSLPRTIPLDTVAEHPSLSYTGRYLTYLTSERGKIVLVLYDRATQQSQTLSQWYQGWVRSPSISPDGRYIVFESSKNGQWDIEILDRGDRVELDIPDGTILGAGG